MTHLCDVGAIRTSRCANSITQRKPTSPVDKMTCPRIKPNLPVNNNRFSLNECLLLAPVSGFLVIEISQHDPEVSHM